MTTFNEATKVSEFRRISEDVDTLRAFARDPACPKEVRQAIKRNQHHLVRAAWAHATAKTVKRAEYTWRKAPANTKAAARLDAYRERRDALVKFRPYHFLTPDFACGVEEAMARMEWRKP